MASDRATAANPSVLRWARDRAGLTLEDVADRMQNKSAEDIRAWEEGEAAPTFVQLETLASRIYKRPVALFFYPEPPDEEPLEHEFRTLPEAERDRLPPDVRFELRRAKSYLLSLRQLTGGENPAERQIWRDLDASIDEPTGELAAGVRNYLDVSLREQAGWGSDREAMKGWRGAVQEAGIYVFKRPFDSEEVSGFCLYDSEFPVIMVNNKNTFTRQVFTLFHEVAHILFGLSGITPEDLTYAGRIEDRRGRQIEITCNELAAEVLVPSDSFPYDLFRTKDDPVESIPTVAHRYSVSREVILRKLLDADIVDQERYEELAHEWSSQRSSEGSGGFYYNNQIAYLGNAFLDLAFSRYHAGLVSRRELAEHLDMSAENVESLDTILLSRK